MVEFLKEIVSGKKRRYRQDGLNLDLTYVTDRIVAMSYPSTGFESMYRNDIDEVAKLFGSKHGSKYLVLNLSERKYNYQKFNNQVIEFAWEDHHSPPLDVLFQACQVMDEFLNRDPENIVVVHCLAGKGRTGTIIACYLLYCGRFDQMKQALKYYKIKRFERGGGVTQPSQVRYVQYFGYVLHGFLHEQKIFEPTVVKIDRMVLYGMPKFSVGYFKPYIELYSVKKRALIYSTKHPERPVPKFIAREDGLHKEKVIIQLPDPVLVCGDILVKVYHISTLGPKLVFRFGFNTTFLIKGQNNQAILPLSIEELDPDSTKADERFPPKFYTEMYMTMMPTMSQESLAANSIAKETRKDDHILWDNIYKILNDYKMPPKEHANILLFKDPQRDDVDKVLSEPKSARVSEAPKDLDGNFSDPNEDIDKAEVLDPEEDEVDRNGGKIAM